MIRYAWLHFLADGKRRKAFALVIEGGFDLVTVEGERRDERLVIRPRAVRCRITETFESGGKRETWVLRPEDVLRERPAEMNRHYGMLEVMH